MVTRRALAIEALAALPALLLVVLAPDPLLAVARFDPLVVFRLLLLLWVLVHMWFIVEHLVEDIRSVQLFLTDLERSNPVWRVSGAGQRAFRWAIFRAVALSLRVGWPTLLLAGLVAALNAVTWFVLAGWRPSFLAAVLP
jgi:hypothetical protein